MHSAAGCFECFAISVENSYRELVGATIYILQFKLSVSLGLALLDTINGQRECVANSQSWFQADIDREIAIISHSRIISRFSNSESRINIPFLVIQLFDRRLTGSRAGRDTGNGGELNRLGLFISARAICEGDIAIIVDCFVYL
ncbi:hypothetical protein GZ78_05290 [Endozoicomonas numazuensis]|uniref:Uncharacterized protein n=1 Tax=Endozoicomonas numazuensis TaxID=1137799 RepID=A0A081NLQ4_9GAMM|nr:hypothetical protein GZ78_05290 [Endozoicomonas numazuensis]